MKKDLDKKDFFLRDYCIQTKKLRELCFLMLKFKHQTIEDIINKLQDLKEKINLHFHRKNTEYYDQRNYMRQGGYSQFEENPFAKNAEGVVMIMH